ncbi:hypothetical protein NC653_010582 [Populus alba x Populus x berolinensis]|uniref:Uncharacterized protein n=1 Tax=Populus alba x Populus x berolinensis TaxID=444605 RepID=A0AAD6W6K1_9ROSI|nr:hypothetical protein NC653_010582 [Populus alba x Populus x berolinensis]
MRQKERMDTLFRTDVKVTRTGAGSAKKILVPGNNISYTLIMSGVLRSQGSCPYFRLMKKAEFDKTYKDFLARMGSFI